MPNEKQYSFNFDNSVLTVKGVQQVMEISDRQAIFKLDGNTLTVKGSGINVTKLDKEQGVVVLEVAALSSLSLRQSGVNLKGLFR
ncbi:MAG: hypothetical protein J1F68_04810 [Clostridiales bacterium]|nr:hypothetical protein [Clostridiales bacterium]